MTARPKKPAMSRRRPLRAILTALTALLVLTGLIALVGNSNAAGSLSIWPSTATPATASYNDTLGVEVGVKFKSDVAGQISGIKFYKGSGNTATASKPHWGHLWSASGTQLAKVKFTETTGTGWQTATFATPVTIAANTVYIASTYDPNGHYAVTQNYMVSSQTALDNPPLHALPTTTAPTGDGVYKYSTADTTTDGGAFPSSSSSNATNYWVDVVFNQSVPPTTTTTPPPTTTTTTTPPPVTGTIWPATTVPGTPASSDTGAVNLGVRFTTDTGGYISGVRFYKGTGNGGTHVGSLWTGTGSLLAQATFTGETASGWQDVQFSSPVLVVAGATYEASYYAPQGHYAADSGGLATAVDSPPLHTQAGGNGVYGYAPGPSYPSQSFNNTNYWVDVDYTSTYTPPAQSTPRAGVRGSGPLLVLTDPTNPFSDEYCSALLQTEGFNTCAATDTANLTSAFPLNNYQTVILADGAPLTASQITQITAWVSAGHTLVAMRPADNLDGLLGLGARSNLLPDAYLKIDTSQAPGAGLDSQTLQFHGVADEHPLAGARVVATLYSDNATATAFPAVTVNQVGSGTAEAFAFDLARSDIFIREGNPGLAGQSTISTDGQPHVADRFSGGWLDPTKVSVPQADIERRLLDNILEQTAAAPLPRLWYFPSYNGGTIQAAIVQTGDDHSSQSETLPRFAAEQAASPAGCQPADWTCYTSTSYAYPNAFSDAAAKPYTDQGFEVSPHVADATSCASNYTTQSQLDALASSAIQAWQTSYPSISAAYPPLTQRFHCYGVWRDYAVVAKVEAAHGIQADTNSACWPNVAFLSTGQCLFTGTGLPGAYTDSDGSLTGVWQFTTQITDENPATVNQAAMATLLSNATGASGYYGFFTALCHLDNLPISNQCASDLLALAQADHLPLISARQAEQFWAGRAATGVNSASYGTGTVSFTVATPVHNLELMQPMKYGAKTLTGITVGGTPVTYTTQTINGVSYAMIAGASAGTYVVSYN